MTRIALVSSEPIRPAMAGIGIRYLEMARRLPAAAGGAVETVLVSPADEDPVDPQDVWPDDMVLAEGLDRYEQAVTVPVTRVERSWAGLRTFAPDRTPVVGFDPAAEGFFWLAGQGGYGIQTAPALSRLAAALLTGGDGSDILPSSAVTALAPHRLRASA